MDKVGPGYLVQSNVSTSTYVQKIFHLDCAQINGFPLNLILHFASLISTPVYQNKNTRFK